MLIVGSFRCLTIHNLRKVGKWRFIQSAMQPCSTHPGQIRNGAIKLANVYYVQPPRHFFFLSFPISPLQLYEVLFFLSLVEGRLLLPELEVLEPVNYINARHCFECQITQEGEIGNSTLTPFPVKKGSTQ